MKKKNILYIVLSIIVLAILSTTILFACGDKKKNNDSSKVNENKKTVIASTYPVYDLTLKITGDKLEVIQLIEGEIHDFKLNPNLKKKLSAASLFLYVSEEEENNSVHDSMPKNSVKILNEKTALKFSNGESDPHIWLSPARAIEMAKTIYDSVVALDKENEKTYEANYNSLKATLEKLDAKYKTELSSAKGKYIFVTHSAFNYVATDYGFTQLGPESEEVDLKTDVKNIYEKMKAVNSKVIFLCEDEGDQLELANTIANEFKAESINIEKNEELLILESKPESMDYIQALEKNLESFKKALNY